MPSSLESWQSAGFGLYVHWPYCQSKCPYCDFNSHVAASIDQGQWIRAYSSEIRRVFALTGPRVLRSIYFGGGTPSLMDAATVETVIAEAARAWSFANDIEITLEANPGSVEAARFSAYREAGVNRVSLGVQALDDSDLKALGRLHSVAEALCALDIARSTFDRVSFDLIYARQGQSLDAWKSELARALDFQPTHLSLYQLTIEPGTAFGDRFAAGKLRGLPDEDLGADLFEVTQDMTSAAGLPAYETSNHAAKDQQSRHNLIYWQGGDWAGIGPGAHGRLTIGGRRHATETPLSPARWLESADAGNGDSLFRAQEPGEIAAEYLMMGLRTVSGVERARLAPIDTARFKASLAGLVELGLVEEGSGRLQLTPAGRPVLNAILRELLPD